MLPLHGEKVRDLKKLHIIDKLFKNTKYRHTFKVAKVFTFNIRILIIVYYLPWWPSCSDRGALNNVDSPGCGKSVVRGPTGHK